MKNYGDRNIELLDEVGGFYSHHVSTMSAEGLSSKSDIAAELGLRDFMISGWIKALELALDENDGFEHYMNGFREHIRDIGRRGALPAIGVVSGNQRTARGSCSNYCEENALRIEIRRLNAQRKEDLLRSAKMLEEMADKLRKKVGSI